MKHHSCNLSDEQLMALALRLGRRGAGLTAENPAVGCVIAHHGKNGTQIVGRGWTQKGGRPHAERVALAEAGDAAFGATAYVSLEPCSHYGKTPPCAEGLIEAGVVRVVCAHPDPDPRVAGRGIGMLRAKGIEVETGLLQAQAHRNLSGFLSRTVRSRPWIQGKMAISPDGKIGKDGLGNFPITGAEAKRRTYALRSRADAILVGADTVLIDDPSLTVRLAGLQHTSPIRVVLDGQGRIPIGSDLAKTARQTPVWILTTGAIAADKALELEALGCRILLVEQSSSNHVDLAQAAHVLAQEGINTLFVECGAKLAEAMFEADLMDEFFLYEGTNPVGENGVIALDGDPNRRLLANGFQFERTEALGKDRLRVYIRPQSLTALYGELRCLPEL